jgi:hypothetical protein
LEQSSHPLIDSILSKNFERAKQLLKDPNTVKEKEEGSGISPLLAAAIVGEKDLAEKIIELGADVKATVRNKSMLQLFFFQFFFSIFFHIFLIAGRERAQRASSRVQVIAWFTARSFSFESER